MFNQKTGNLTFVLAKMYLSTYLITCEFFQIFSNLKIFFFFFCRNNRVTKFVYVFVKRLRTALKKFLDNRSKRFADTTQTFFDKQDFQKLGKNRKKFYVFGQIDKSVLSEKKLRYSLFVEHFFLLIC